LTVSREFGSGGGRIAQTIARLLGWKLLDREIIDAIAYAGRVPRDVARDYDEHVETWLGRLNQQAMRGAALAAGLELGPDVAFDADTLARISQRLIEEAYSEGNCVIVGRGAQCILQSKPDAYHVFIYAPFQERVKRLQSRLEKGANVEERIRAVDGERFKYLQEYFGQAWNNPHLYNLMISSGGDEEATARLILCAMTGEAKWMSAQKAA
jgi:cytidylate kinase